MSEREEGSNEEETTEETEIEGKPSPREEFSETSTLVDDGRFEIEKYASRDVLTRASFGEERVKRVVATADGFVGRHLPVRVDAMLYI